jgi:predicted neutral ceramidase superfamily lipid hydrolase
MRENERYDPVTKKELKNIVNAVEQAVQKSKEQNKS